MGAAGSRPWAQSILSVVAGMLLVAAFAPATAVALPGPSPAHTLGTNGPVRALLQVGNVMWVGGRFTSLSDGTGVSGLAALDVDSGDEAPGVRPLRLSGITDRLRPDQAREHGLRGGFVHGTQRREEPRGLQRPDREVDQVVPNAIPEVGALRQRAGPGRRGQAVGLPPEGQAGQDLDRDRRQGRHVPAGPRHGRRGARHRARSRRSLLGRLPVRLGAEPWGVPASLHADQGDREAQPERLGAPELGAGRAWGGELGLRHRSLRRCRRRGARRGGFRLHGQVRHADRRQDLLHEHQRLGPGRDPLPRRLRLPLHRGRALPLRRDRVPPTAGGLHVARGPW